MNDDSSTPMTSDTDIETQSTQATRSNGETNGTLRLGSRDIRTLLNYAALALFVLFALVSVIQLYSAVGNVINQLISPEYRAFFRAAFNLAVLLVCVGGISMQLKRLT